MSLEITHVPIGGISNVLPSVLGYLEVSEKWTFGRSSVDDILRMLFNGQTQLWLVYSTDDLKVYGHIITEVKQYPQCKMLVIQNCAMEPHIMVDIEDKMQEIAEGFAKDVGCDGIELVGRPGWGKRIGKYGYDVQHVTYQKFFGEPK
jgi:hypothetical protein